MDFSLDDLRAFEKAHPIGQWLRPILALVPHGEFVASRHAREHIDNAISLEVHRGSVRWGHLHDWLMLGTLMTRGRLLHTYRVTRELTPSAMRNRSLPKLAGMFRRLQASLAPLYSVDCLENYAHFVDFWAITLQRRRAFESRIANFSEGELRLFVTAAEFQFSGLIDLRQGKTGTFARSPDDITAEDVASGVSYILTTHNRIRGTQLGDFYPIYSDVDALRGTLPLICDALDLFAIDEAEVDVFRGGYRCIPVAKREWLVASVGECAERSVELANLEFEWRANGRARKHIIAPDEMTFAGLTENWLNQVSDDIFVRVAGPIPRVRMEMPAPVAAALGKMLLDRAVIFAEESLILWGTSQELVARIEEIRDVAVSGTHTLWDILVISRIFKLISSGWTRAIRRALESHDPAAFNSILIVPMDSVFDLLVSFGLSEEQARDYTAAFTWNTADRNSYVDLQYRPFIRLNDKVAVLTGIHVGSAMTRNVLIAEHKRLSSGGLPDMVTRSLYETIRKQFDRCATEVKFRFRKEESDCDVLWRIGDTIYVFECKNGIKPCSSFEMRSTWDQLDKGADQLDRFLRLWRDPEFRQALDRRLGFKVSDVTSVGTAIVLGHRTLSGTTHRGHPVRYLATIQQFITDGKAEFGLEEHVHFTKYWVGHTLDEVDMTSFLADSSLVYRHFWESQERQEFRVRYSEATMVRVRYPVDLGRLCQILDVSDEFREALSALANSN